MNIKGRKSIAGDGSCMQHFGAADGQPTSVCSLEATLAAWPKPRSPADLRSAPKCFPFLGVVLSQDGRELWTATEGNSSGGISVTGYKRVVVGDRWQWQLTHSFAALSGLSRDAQTSRVVMHLLPASKGIVVVCSNGMLFVLCIEDTAAPPLRIPLENYMRPKSCTVVRTMRRDIDTAPVDMITHVRLMVTRRVIALEHCIVAQGPRAAKGKVVVEVNLQSVWDSCTARTVAGPAAPSSLQDCAWAGAGADGNSWRSSGNNDTVLTSQAQTSGMLLALNTAILRIAPATQRRVLEDGAGIRKERWAAAVLPLPLLMGPLPALHDDHERVPSQGCISDVGSHPGSGFHPAEHAQPHTTSFTAHRTTSSVADSLPDHLGPSTASVLTRFFGTTVTPARHANTTVSTSGAGARYQALVPSSFEGRASGFNSGTGAASNVGSGAGVPSSRFQKRAWILPLVSTLPNVASGVTDSNNHSGGLASGPPGRSMKFLVVSPPFVIAVDSFGQPDQRHSMLDIPASFAGTRLEGTELQILDAAVVSDKLVLATPTWLLIYEWASTSAQGTDPMSTPASAVQSLELIQYEILAPESFSQWPLRLHLHGGAACTNFVLAGSLRVSVYAPEATAKRAYRMVMKGDMQRVLDLLRSESIARSTGDTVWQQRIVGISVAHCLKRGRWKWALQFFSLAKRTHLHPCQLLAAIVPTILAGDSPTEEAADVIALRNAARASLKELVASQCHEQHGEVTALFMELLDSPPVDHLGTLLEGCRSRRPRNLELASQHSMREPESTTAKHNSSAGSVAEAKEACLQMAAVLCRSLEDELPGSAGAQPGEERFDRLFCALAAAGELYPHLERGLPGRLHFIQPPQRSIQATQASTASALCSISHPMDASDGPSGVITNGKQRVHMSPSTGYCSGARQEEGQRRLDHLDWCKAAQIWLLELAGDWRSVEAICWRPGLWGSKTSRQIEQFDDGCRLRDHLASFLQARGQARAVGLLLASLGKPQRALEVWMEEYYAQSSACHEHDVGHNGQVPLDEFPILHESRTVDEHILSASAIGAGNVLAMLDPATPPPLGTPTTPVTNQSLLEAEAVTSSDTLTPPAVEVDTVQLSAASSALLLAACASECMCDSEAVPSFDDSLISWLLRMPVQCSLAVLLSRKDITFEDVFSPYHALGGLHIVSGGLSSATKAGTAEPVLPEESGTLNMSPDASDDDSSDSDGAPVNCSQLWLQVRYFRARVAEAQAGAAGDVQNLHDDHTQPSVSKPVGNAELFWGMYLTQLLKLLLKSESFTERPVPNGDSEHAVYGSQTLQSGFSVEQPWMSGQFIGCLRSTEASSQVAAMLVPLRPVTIAPCAQLDQAPIIDAPEGLQVEFASQQEPAALTSPATPRLTSTPSLPVALLPSAELQLGSANTYSPIAQLFLEALRAAPPAVMASVSRNLEQTINDAPVKTALRKEVYLAVLEQLHTKTALVKALHMLTPAPYRPDSDEEDEVMYGGRRPAPLQDLSMAISLAARYTISGTNSTSLEATTQQNEAEDMDAGSSDVATELWKELLARTTAAGKVLVQYNQQLVTASNLNQSQQLDADQDLLWNNILKVSNPGNSNACLASASDDESEPQQLLKDAAAAITSVVRTVSMRSEASTLHRFMRQQFKIQVARKTLTVEDSYVKWNEGPTSMDSSMDPEGVVQRTPDNSGDRRSIPPPGKDGSPWCGVCKRSLVQSGSRYFSKGNHISWSCASFVCSDPACVAAATAPETDGAPSSPGPVSSRSRPRSSSPDKLPADQPKSVHPPQIETRIKIPGEAHVAQAVQIVDDPGRVSVLRKPPSGVFLQLSVSFDGLHKPPGRAATAAGVENATCGTAHFGHRWLLSDRGYISVSRHATVGSGAAEILLSDAGSSSPSRPVQPHERESGTAVLAGSVPGSPVGSRRRNASLACVVVNPDDPATAFVAAEVPAQEAYESFATFSVQGHVDVTRSGAHGGGRHLRRPSFRSTYSTVESGVVACLVRAVDRAVSPRATGAAANRLHMKLQRIVLPVEHSGSTRVCDAIWGGEGRQVLLGTACGTLFCVDTAGASVAPEADGDGAETQVLTARRITAIPEAYGSLEALAFARLDAGEAALISTTSHVLLIAGHGIVGALRRFEKCRALWATAVVFEDFSSRSDVLSRTRLTVTQSPTSSVAHIAWLCGKVMHSVDMHVVGAAPSTSRPWCATAHNLLKEDTYSRIALPGTFVKGTCVSMAVLPHHVLVLSDGPTGVPQVNAIWRASGTHACSVSVYEDIGQPVSLVLDAEDPAASLDESLAVYILGTAGVAKLDTQQGPLAGAWDLIRAGRYSQAAEKIRQVAQGPSGVGPVGESAMWGALGQALVERGWHVEGARALGRVVPGVLHAADGKHIRSFHDTVLQFCVDGLPRKVLQAFLLSKLQTLTRHFENDLSVCGIVTWLLRLHLEDLHVATMRADVSPEASGEPGVEQARICALIRRHQAVVDYRTVLDLFRQHGHPKLQLFVMDLYGRHVDSFNMALQDKVPKALHLLNSIQTHKPELLPSLVAQLMWEHPIATCTVLAVGRSTIDPMLVVRAAFRYAKPSESPFFERVQEALQKFLTGHIEAGCVDSGLHNLFVRLAALRGDEQELVRYLDSVDANRSTDSKRVSGNTDSKKSPQDDTLAQLHFDSRSTLLLARQRKLNMAVHRLLILRGDISAALEYCKGVEDARDAVSRAPGNRQRDLWLQFVRIRKETMPEITVRDLQDIVEAAEGLLTFPDVVKFVSEEYRSSEEVQEALAANLEAGSAKLRIMQKQFEGFGERMEARRKELERLKESRKKTRASPTAKCEACKGLLWKPAKRGAPYGGALPPVVAYDGSMYHTACAAIAHAQFMDPQARQKWALKLLALSRAPPKGGTLPPHASQAQKVAHQRIQVYLKELSDLLTKRGDPSLSLKQLDKLEELYGERQPGFEHELLKVPDPVL